MKTYNYLLLLAAVVFFGCDSTEDTKEPESEIPSVDADYTVLLTSNNLLSSALLNADGETIGLNPGISPFGNSQAPDLSYRDEEQWGFYFSKPDCSGEINRYNFRNYESETYEVFEEDSDCERQIKALAFWQNKFFLGYEMPGAVAGEKSWHITIVDSSAGGMSFRDIELPKSPLQFVGTQNRLFILGLEEDGDYSLLVMDIDSEELIHEINLDTDVLKLFKTRDGNIMVSYPQLHLVIDRGSMAIINTVRYQEGKEPGFGFNEGSFIDDSGNLYYRRPTDLTGTEYPNIPGVYEFDRNTAILYYYENFLTEEERLFEYEIGDTTMVAFDSKNNLLLIGYRKLNNPEQGGMLRIRPVPEPAFIDNLDLPGVPLEVFVD